MAASPCQAQTTVKSPINVTETQDLTSTESPDVTNSSVSNIGKTPNTSKSFTLSELNTTPSNSSPSITTPQNQSTRTNPLGCRFFTTPSMQQ
ncbi:hypothetical protein H6F85_17595 [Microcoleus sp. FACHB-45]|nr:hypothetical protein [Microcoleus sp. FACHB-45]